jgi:hypothetical protein
MKYYELVPFDIRVTAETVIDALAEDDGTGAQAAGMQPASTEESSQ